MPPLPANSTDRYFLDYTVAGFQHTLAMRTDPAIAEADALATLNAFMDVVGPFCYPITVDGARFQATGENVSVDVVWTGAAGWGTGTPIPANTAQFYDFVGRDAQGHRVRVFVYGAGLVTSGGDYRITDSEAGWVSDAYAALVSDNDAWLSIGGLNPVWKTYVNCGPSAYWRNKVR
jgi:hypothetical protein